MDLELIKTNMAYLQKEARKLQEDIDRFALDISNWEKAKVKVPPRGTRIEVSDSPDFGEFPKMRYSSGVLNEAGELTVLDHPSSHGYSYWRPITREKMGIFIMRDKGGSYFFGTKEVSVRIPSSIVEKITTRVLGMGDSLEV